MFSEVSVEGGLLRQMAAAAGGGVFGMGVNGDKVYIALFAQFDIKQK